MTRGVIPEGIMRDERAVLKVEDAVNLADRVDPELPSLYWAFDRSGVTIEVTTVRTNEPASMDGTDGWDSADLIPSGTKPIVIRVLG